MTSPTSGPIHPTIECERCKAKVMLSVYVWSDVRNILSSLGWVRETYSWECPDCHKERKIPFEEKLRMLMEDEE